MTNENLLASNDDQHVIDENKDYYAELTGPGGKYDRSKYASDEEMHKAMAKGTAHADHFIRTKNKAFDDLSSDYLKVREEVNSRASLQELIDRLENLQLASNNNTEVKEVKEQPVFDPKQIDDLVTSKTKAAIQEYELTKMQQNNINEVRSKLTERFGSNYQSQVKQQMNELGVSDDLFNTLAMSNPKLLYRTLGLDQPVRNDNFQAPPQSSRNSGAFAPSGGEKRTWTYYQKMKQSNPRAYTDPKTQMQMNQDYANLGAEFEDGDFHTNLYKM